MDRFVKALEQVTMEKAGSPEPVTLDSGQYLLSFSHESVVFDDAILPEFTADVLWPDDLGFFCRFWRAVKYVFGWRSRFGDSDTFEVNENEAKSLIRLAEYHRDFSEADIAEKNGATK